MSKVFENISQMAYEYIIFDAPPSETLADADVLSQYTNLNLFVISLNQVERRSVKKVINKLSKISNGQIGLVINYLREEDSLLNNYGYRYKYNNEIYKYYNKKEMRIILLKIKSILRKIKFTIFKRNYQKIFCKF